MNATFRHIKKGTSINISKGYVSRLKTTYAENVIMYLLKEKIIQEYQNREWRNKKAHKRFRKENNTVIKSYDSNLNILYYYISRSRGMVAEIGAQYVQE